MKIVCAWCKKSMGEKEPLNDGRISHGICPECRMILLAAAAEQRIPRAVLIPDPSIFGPDDHASSRGIFIGSLIVSALIVVIGTVIYCTFF